MDRVSPGIGKTTCAFYWPGPADCGGGDVLFASTHQDPEAQTEMQAELDFLASCQSRRYSWDYDTTMNIFVAPAKGGELLNGLTPRATTQKPGTRREAS